MLFPQGDMLKLTFQFKFITFFLYFQQPTENSCCAKITIYLFPLEHVLHRGPPSSNQAGIWASESGSPGHQLLHATAGGWENDSGSEGRQCSNCHLVWPCAQEWRHLIANSCHVQLNQQNSTHCLNLCAGGCWIAFLVLDPSEVSMVCKSTGSQEPINMSVKLGLLSNVTHVGKSTCSVLPKKNLHPSNLEATQSC